MRTFLFALTTGLVLCTTALPAPAAPSSVEAKTFTAESRAILAAFKGRLRTNQADFTAELRNRLGNLAANAAPADVVAEVSGAWGGLYGALQSERLNGIRNELDVALADILADGGVTFAPGLVSGDGGALDKVNDRIVAEFAKVIRACGAITRREVDKAIRSNPDMRFTIRTFGYQDAAIEAVAGTIGGNGPSSFADFAPLAIFGCGVTAGADGNAAFGIIARGNGAGSISLNLYNGENGLIRAVATDLTADADTLVSYTFTHTFTGLPHGNAYVEVFRTDIGWTRSIGY